MTRKLYQELASLVVAIANCEKTGNEEWKGKHEDRIVSLVDSYMPSGSGWDRGTKFDFEGSRAERLIFTGTFHHMNGDGYYDGWTDHSIIVTPSLMSGFELRITGKNRNDIKDHLHEIFDYALNREIEPKTATAS
jgi:hypothetical protein